MKIGGGAVAGERPVETNRTCTHCWDFGGNGSKRKGGTKKFSTVCKKAKKRGDRGRRERAEGLGEKGGCGIYEFTLFYGKPFWESVENIKNHINLAF